MADDSDEPEILPPEVRTAATELIWRCSRCGYQRPRDGGLARGHAKPYATPPTEGGGSGASAM